LLGCSIIQQEGPEKSEDIIVSALSIIVLLCDQQGDLNLLNVMLLGMEVQVMLSTIAESGGLNMLLLIQMLLQVLLFSNSDLLAQILMCMFERPFCAVMYNIGVLAMGRGGYGWALCL